MRCSPGPRCACPTRRGYSCHPAVVRLWAKVGEPSADTTQDCRHTCTRERRTSGKGGGAFAAKDDPCVAVRADGLGPTTSIAGAEGLIEKRRDKGEEGGEERRENRGSGAGRRG